MKQQARISIDRNSSMRVLTPRFRLLASFLSRKTTKKTQLSGEFFMQHLSFSNLKVLYCD
ncbi:hypothetical protein CCR75_003451 [Bremia lactucae]|uniref:Uncharacterized protein n=1 Tax=Bremia lactucae TaxID=4779 RepID=A0A976FJ98_BRELC|nr:hypothetical protein CCR75_003451 [Bremia lactucae]